MTTMTTEYAFPMVILWLMAVIVGWYYIIRNLIEHHQNG